MGRNFLLLNLLQVLKILKVRVCPDWPPRGGGVFLPSHNKIHDTQILRGHFFLLN